LCEAWDWHSCAAALAVASAWLMKPQRVARWLCCAWALQERASQVVVRLDCLYNLLLPSWCLSSRMLLRRRQASVNIRKLRVCHEPSWARMEGRKPQLM
jgi:hypothetical protein